MEKQVDKRGRVIAQQIPLRGVRKVIGQRMRQSLDTAPQATIMSKADMSQVVKFRKELKEKGISVSFTDIFIKATAFAAQEIPMANATRDEKFITVFETVNAGIAVMAGDLLIVPVVTNVHEKSLEEISKETKEIIANARAMKFDRIPLDGATITVNNLGMFDVDECTPVVNMPEAAIIAFGAMRKEVWVEDDGSFVAKETAQLSLSFDHAIIDGGMAGQFIMALKKVLAAPQEYIKV